MDGGFGSVGGIETLLCPVLTDLSVAFGTRRFYCRLPSLILVFLIHAINGIELADRESVSQVIRVTRTVLSHN
jgi:hypothetical protein